MFDKEQLEAIQEYLKKEFDTPDPAVTPQQTHSDPAMITARSATPDSDHIDDRPYFLTIIKMVSDNALCLDNKTSFKLQGITAGDMLRGRSELPD